MAGKIDADLIAFLHKMLDTLGAPALHDELDALNGEVADDIKAEHAPENASDTVKPAAGAPVVSTSKP